MEVITQNFDDPEIDWTKANLLQGVRVEVLILNDPTVEVGETAAGTCIAYTSTLPEDDPDRIDFIIGKYYTDLNPDTFKIFNGQALLSNS